MADIKTLKELQAALHEIQDTEKKIGKSGALDGIKNHLNDIINSLKITSDKTREAGSAFDTFSDALSQAASSSDSLYRSVGIAQAQFNNLKQIVSTFGDNNPIKGVFNVLFKGIETIDKFTQPTRNFKESLLGLGSGFGESFRDVIGGLNKYEESILLASSYTYEGIDTLQRYAKELSNTGLTVEQLSRTFDIGGTKQNLLTQSLLLSIETGLDQNTVFETISNSVRKMGLSFEDSSKPLVELSNLARDTGLPIKELRSDIYRIVEDNARFGISVQSLSPIVKRFTEVLGEGFKGFASRDVQTLIGGLVNQVNSTTGAFIALKGGISAPGRSALGASLDFEAALDKPEKLIQALSKTIGGVTGGKIIGFDEARKNPELETQFKIQRDLLRQFAGVSDSQQQRTILNVLADIQSGRKTSERGQQTIGDLLKSAQQKEDESRSSQEKIGKLTNTLLATISLQLSNRAESFFNTIGLSQQNLGSMIRKGEHSGVSGLQSVFGFTDKIGDAIQQAFKDSGVDLSTYAGTLRELIDKQEITAINAANFNLPTPKRFDAPKIIDRQVAQNVENITTGARNLANDAGKTGEKVIRIVVDGTDELSAAIQKMFNKAIKSSAKGGGVP